MSAVQKCLNSCLLFPKIYGSHLFNAKGQLEFTQIIRIILYLSTFMYFLVQALKTPIARFFDLLVLLDVILIFSVVALLLRASWQKEHWKKFLKAMETISTFLDVEIKINLWPSFFSSVLIMVGATLRGYMLQEPLFNSLVFMLMMLVINALADEFSNLLLLLGFLCNALNVQLTKAKDRNDLDFVLRAHKLLCAAVGHINHLYSVQLLLIMAFSFHMFITFSFVFIAIVNIDFKKALNLLLIFNSFQLALKIILSASSLSSQMRAFDVRLYEMLKTRPSSWAVLVKIEDFYIDRSIQLSAAGCFDLTIESLGSTQSLGNSECGLEEQSVTSFDTGPLPTSPRPIQGKGKKMKFRKPDELSELDSAIQRTNDDTRKRKNPYLSFGEHVANKLLTYDDYTRSQVEFQISKVLHEADMVLFQPSRQSSSQNTNTAQSNSNSEASTSVIDLTCPEMDTTISNATLNKKLKKERKSLKIF